MVKLLHSEAIQKQNLHACMDLNSVNSVCIGKIRISNLENKQNGNQILEIFTQSQNKQNIFINYMCANITAFAKNRIQQKYNN